MSIERFRMLNEFNPKNNTLKEILTISRDCNNRFQGLSKSVTKYNIPRGIPGKKYIPKEPCHYSIRRKEVLSPFYKILNNSIIYEIIKYLGNDERMSFLSISKLFFLNGIRTTPILHLNNLTDKHSVAILKDVVVLVLLTYPTNKINELNNLLKLTLKLNYINVIYDKLINLNFTNPSLTYLVIKVEGNKIKDEKSNNRFDHFSNIDINNLYYDNDREPPITKVYCPFIKKYYLNISYMTDNVYFCNLPYIFGFRDLEDLTIKISGKNNFIIFNQIIDLLEYISKNCKNFKILELDLRKSMIYDTDFILMINTIKKLYNLQSLTLILERNFLSNDLKNFLTEWIKDTTIINISLNFYGNPIDFSDFEIENRSGYYIYIDKLYLYRCNL